MIDQENISFKFFTRQGGVSDGTYASLNCSPQSGDNLSNVAENLRRVLDEMGGDSLSTLKQIHSPLCHIVESGGTQGFEEGDALVTRIPGQILGVLTADCAPVLLSGVDGDGEPVIGAAHAGWGGALKGVLESTVAAMKNLRVVPSTIQAVIGPCISPQSYEVGAAFVTPFVDEDEQAVEFFTSKGGEFYFDLPGYIRFRLKRMGLVRAPWTKQDTYADEQAYFSFRRTTHRGENSYGRQISAIMIRKG